MFTVYNGYSPIKLGGRHVFFAGANTDGGFVSSYDTIANEKECERVYIIKGGSGSGKSTLMRNIAKKAEKNGFGFEYYLCGSDADSLDCIKLDGRIAVLDGTSPHVREMAYPGAASELIDVTPFWDISALEAKREEITALCERKREAYSSAYRLLGAAGLVNRASVSLASRMYLFDKADAFITRLLSRLPKTKEEGSVIAEYYSHAVTMKGMYRTDSLSRFGELSYTVENIMNTAQIFMRRLADKLVKCGQKIIITRIPLSGEISGIFIAEHGISVTVGEKTDETRGINLMRFIDRDIMKAERGRMKLYSSLLESAENEAVSLLAGAAEAHFKIEGIYVSAMDFERLEKYGNAVCTDIMKRLKDTLN